MDKREQEQSAFEEVTSGSNIHRRGPAFVPIRKKFGSRTIDPEVKNMVF